MAGGALGKEAAMKRIPCTNVLMCALAATACIVSRPATAQQRVAVPDLTSPELFDGFQPTPPDGTGFSPTGKFLLLEDNLGVRIVRSRNFAEVFRTQSRTSVDLGFDPSDRRMFVLEQSGTGYRLRFINPETGAVLQDQRFQDRPDIRTNFNAGITLVTTRNRDRALTLVFNVSGQITYRRYSNGFVQAGLAPFGPLAAFVERSFGDAGSVSVVNATNGRITTRETFQGRFTAGFEPGGPDFVFVESTGTNTFRVSLTNGTNGKPLVNQSFFGAFSVGFTADSEKLVVVARDPFETRVNFYRTKNGNPVAR